MNADIRPYRVAIPQPALDDLDERLAHVIWPGEVAGAGRDYGVPASRVARLVRYWRESFDWRAYEARLNQYPQFVTEIDGATIHFLHIRSSREDAIPLILTHGWPGSVAEYLDVIGPLTEPATTPTALAMFAGDFQSIRRFADRDHHTIVSWHSYGSPAAPGRPADAAGHYAAHEATDVLAADVRGFFRRR